MSSIIGKKKRSTNPRISSISEAYAVIIIEKLHKLGAFSPDGKVIYPVIKDYFIHNCTNYRIYKDPYTGEIREEGLDKFTKFISEGLLSEGVKWEPGVTNFKKRHILPKRWADTTPKFRSKMVLNSLMLQNIPHRSMTFWIGDELLETSRTKDVQLVRLIQKRLREGLQRQFPNADFNFWFHTEHVQFEPNDIHAHGIISANDERWLTSNLRQNEKLRKAIRDITGDNGSHGKNWLNFSNKDLDTGWINYSYKNNPAHNRSKYDVATTPDIYGATLSAGSRMMTQSGKEFYERIRPLLIGILTNGILEMTDEDWHKIGVVFEDDEEILIGV